MASPGEAAESGGEMLRMAEALCLEGVPRLRSSARPEDNQGHSAFMAVRVSHRKARSLDCTQRARGGQNVFSGVLIEPSADSSSPRPVATSSYSTPGPSGSAAYSPRAPFSDHLSLASSHPRSSSSLLNSPGSLSSSELGEEEEEGEEEEQEQQHPLGRGASLAPSTTSPAPGEDRWLSKRERARAKNLRRRQRRRERWRQNQQQEHVQSSTANPSSSSEDEDRPIRDREGFICAVCLDVYFSPCMCHPCNHIFCEPCLRTLAKNCPTNTPCPLCRTAISHVFFHKELNHIVRTFFPKEYLSRKQTFQKASCAKWPLPSCRKLFRILGGFQRQAGPITRRQFPHGGYQLNDSDYEADSRGWRFDMDMVIIYIYSVNWVIGFIVFCFLCYFFFPSF
ncbi:E3 ubiquitin-protein ligase RNF180 [Denticeps clupeoides]|uniref:E3 ubiquitin-protein ligase RNF180 n=1 Tax=Denticeps clupeoides TaxID=299321 RepID=A0AAY4AM76_9TELE|nr:E3 ubiquitin-protein ligase RNF180 [Denticeps clupeoides]XP_028832906.1 E3 ubiquitin-protein ligase RNF180 [Denticeps clupeoides]